MLEVGLVFGALWVFWLTKLLLTNKVPKLKVTTNPKIRVITANCKSFRKAYVPTFWCSLGTAMTIIPSLLRKLMWREYPYVREILETKQGHVCLDWANSPEEEHESGEKKPFVVFVSGITGTSQAPYVIKLVEFFRNKGWNCACYVYRGMDGVKLQTPFTYHAGLSSDLEKIVLHIHSQYPKNQICVVGVSLGGMIAFNSLSKSVIIQKEVSAVVCLSMPWNPFRSSSDICNGFAFFIYNYPIVRALRQTILTNIEIFKTLGFITEQLVKGISTIKAFDQLVVSKMGGYKSCDEYYTDAGPAFNISSITKPLLAINARDDLFSSPLVFPSQFEMDRCTAPIALLEYPFGGHVGFASKLTATDLFVCPVAFEFLEQALATEATFQE